MKKHLSSNRMVLVRAISAVAFAVIVFTARSAQCTTHFIYYDGTSVWVASDGLHRVVVTNARGDIVDAKRLEACKQLAWNNIIVIPFGTVAEMKGSEQHSFYDIAAPIIRGPGTAADKQQALITQGEENFYRIISRKDPEFKDAGHEFLGWQMIWFERGKPYVHIVFIQPDAASHQITVYPLGPYPLDPKRRYQYPLVHSCNTPGCKDSFLTDNMVDPLEASDPQKYLNDSLDYASRQDEAATIAPPNAIVKLSESGLTWVQGDLCRQRMLSK